jgi:arsenate reductase-like glutaredoxin family protein
MAMMCVYLAIQMLGIAGAADNELTGVDLFIEACRWQGLNPAMIRTGYAEFEMEVTTRPPSDAEIQKEIDEVRESFRKMIAKQSKNQKEQSRLQDALKTIPDAVRSQRTGSRRSRVRVLFDGNDVTFGKRRSELIKFSPAVKKWNQPLIALRRGLTKEGEDNVLWDASASLATVSKDAVGGLCRRIDHQDHRRLSRDAAILD